MTSSPGSLVGRENEGGNVLVSGRSLVWDEVRKVGDERYGHSTHVAMAEVLEHVTTRNGVIDGGMEGL